MSSPIGERSCTLEEANAAIVDLYTKNAEVEQEILYLRQTVHDLARRVAQLEERI